MAPINPKKRPHMSSLRKKVQELIANSPMTEAELAKRLQLPMPTIRQVTQRLHVTGDASLHKGKWMPKWRYNQLKNSKK